MSAKDRSKPKGKKLVEDAAVGTSIASDPPRAAKKPKKSTQNTSSAQEIEVEAVGLVAVVVGATGAVGRVRHQLTLDMISPERPEFAVQVAKPKTNSFVAVSKRQFALF